jgi:hypothetical protein
MFLCWAVLDECTRYYLGLVSGKTTASPTLLASSAKCALVLAFSSEHVKPTVDINNRSCVKYWQQVYKSIEFLCTYMVPVTNFPEYQVPIIGKTQCCGSGSGIRCIFSPRIRDDFFPDPGSRILTTSQIQDFTFKNGDKQEKLNNDFNFDLFMHEKS